MTRCESLAVDDEASKGMSGWMKCLLTPWQSRSGVVLEPTVVIDTVINSVPAEKGEEAKAEARAEDVMHSDVNLKRESWKLLAL